MYAFGVGGGKGVALGKIGVLNKGIRCFCNQPAIPKVAC